MRPDYIVSSREKEGGEQQIEKRGGAKEPAARGGAETRSVTTTKMGYDPHTEGGQYNRRKKCQSIAGLAYRTFDGSNKGHAAQRRG